MSTVSEPAMVRYRDAIHDAIADEMRADESVCVLGIDVARAGGIFTITQGLLDEFGEERVRDTPISEMAYVGAAVGAAATGLRPIVEIQYMDFIGACFDPLLNQASKLRYMTGGRMSFPLVVRTQVGLGRSSAAQHSQSLEAIVAHIPGLKVAMPGSVADAYALMRAAVRDDNPVVFIENRRLYNRKEPFAAGAEALPLGRGRVARPGRDVTVVAWSRLLPMALEVADDLAPTGVEVEVIDPRTIVPLDLELILESVARTNRLVVAHDAVVDFGAGAEIVAKVTEAGFELLDAPPVRLGTAPVPIPFSPVLEAACTPGPEPIKDAIATALAG